MMHLAYPKIKNATVTQERSAGQTYPRSMLSVLELVSPIRTNVWGPVPIQNNILKFDNYGDASRPSYKSNEPHMLRPLCDKIIIFGEHPTKYLPACSVFSVPGAH